MPDPDGRTTAVVAVQALAPDAAEGDTLAFLAELADLAATPDPATIESDGDGGTVGRVAWQIENDADAEWALSVLASAEASIAAAVEHAEAIKRRAEEWADRIVNERRTGEGGRSLPSLVESARIMRAHLEWYGRRQREAGRATVDLMGGKVATRKVPAAVVVTDEAAVLEWAEGNAPELVRTRKDVQVSTLRKWVTPAAGGKVALQPPTGDDEDPRPPVVLDAIPGVAVEPEGVGVSVTARTVDP